MRKTSLICGILGMAVAVSASASIIQFDPDGPGPNPTVNAASLDFLPGDALMVYNGGSSGTLLYQAKLGSVVDGSGNPISIPGLNSSYEITAVFGVDVQVTVLPGSSTGAFLFNTLPTPGNNAYYSLYFDRAMDANNLTGAGFRDGQKIFGASIDYVLGSALADLNRVSPLDQANPSNFIGINTPQLAGGGTVSGDTTSIDPAYFPDSSAIKGMITHGTIVAPFTDVDPSMNFVVGADGFTANAPFLVTTSNGDQGELAFESDGATSFTVPEPGAFACLLPIAALALRRRKTA